MATAHSARVIRQIYTIIQGLPYLEVFYEKPDYEREIFALVVSRQQHCVLVLRLSNPRSWHIVLYWKIVRFY